MHKHGPTVFSTNGMTWQHRQEYTNWSMPILYQEDTDLMAMEKPAHWWCHLSGLLRLSRRMFSIIWAISCEWAT